MFRNGTWDGKNMVNGMLNRIPNDMDFTDMTCNHKCSCCGSCCTPFLPVTKKEIAVLKDYIKKNNIKGSYLSDFDEHTIYAFCPLLDVETNKCRVYPVRPFVCRKFKCDKNKETLKQERIMYAERADYNSFIKNNPVASLQFLLYEDARYDIQYRHLQFKHLAEQDSFLKLKIGELTLEREMVLQPMLVDKFIIKKGGE